MKTTMSAPLIVLSVLQFVAGCSSVQSALDRNKPTARLLGVELTEAKLDSVKMLFDVEIDNHYPVALPLTNFDYSLTSSSEELVSGGVASAASIPAKGSQAVSLPATVNYLRIIQTLKDVRPGSKIPYKADVTLFFDAPAIGLIKLPIKKEGELTLPTVSGTDVQGIWNFLKPK